MLICEIFSSIDGEGIRAGYPTTFIRTVGCNLRCSYCDSTYSHVATEDTKNMSVEDIVSRVLELRNKRVTFTGGEPLLQDHSEIIELLTRLYNLGIDVNIETNGAVEICTVDKLRQLLGPREENSIFFTLDYKCPSSGMMDHMYLQNWKYLTNGDVIKFVVGDIQDLECMKNLVTECTAVQENPFIHIFVSPVFGKIEPKEIVRYLLNNNLQNVRVQLQLHKIIWDPDMKGV